MCYETDLLTECLITHITSVWALTTTYITEKPAFSIIYRKLFIQGVLVKTKKLNITIYSDRKIITSIAM